MRIWGKVVTGPPCISCCNSYKNRWTAKEKDDEIKVGDVVERYVNGKFYSTGIFLGEDGGYWNCLFCFHVLTIINKTAINICVGFCVDRSFQVNCVNT